MSTDPRVWIAALRHSHDRLAALAGSLREDRLTSPSYDTEWNIAQVFSHLGSGAEISQITLDSALTGAGTLDRDRFPPIWDVWNAKTPQQQFVDGLVADEAHVSRLEELSDADLAAIRFEFFGTDLDAVGLIRLRLSEHAMHTWDVAVAIDPAAMLAPDAVALLRDYGTRFAQRIGRPEGKHFRARLRGSFPDFDLLLDVGEGVTLAAWPAGGPPDIAAGEVRLPAEALLRLFYGRLDPAHTPPVEVSGDDDILDRIRAVFPGL